MGPFRDARVVRVDISILFALQFKYIHAMTRIDRRLTMFNIVRGVHRFKQFVILCSAVVALVTAAGVPSLQAQSARALEVRHQRLVPLFEVAGVVFTDADEKTGRLVVGVLDRDVESLVREKIPFLGVSQESVDIVETEPIFQVATLRDEIRPIPAGVQIRFSQYLCSLGFNAVMGGTAGYVTASHCSNKQGQVDGTNYYQPLNQVAEEFIGTEVVDPAFFKSTNGCPRGKNAAIPIQTSAVTPIPSTLVLVALPGRPDRTTAH
jgi:hypothetical protein